MKKWYVACSKDAAEIDYEEVIESENEPGFWELYEIAENNNCEWFTCNELEGE